MTDNPNPSLDPGIRQWIEKMFLALKFGRPQFLEGTPQETDGGTSGEAGLLRQQLQLRIEAVAVPRDAAPKETAVLDNTRRALEEAIAKAATPDALLRLEPKVAEYETAVPNVARAVELRRGQAGELMKRLTERNLILSGATDVPPPLDKVFGSALSDGVKVAMLLSPPLTDEGIAEARTVIDRPLGDVTRHFAGLLDKPLDPSVPVEVSGPLGEMRSQLVNLAGVTDLARLVEALPDLTLFGKKVDEANRSASEARLKRVERAETLRQRAQQMALPTDYDAEEKQRLGQLQIELPKLSNTDPPETALLAYEQALDRLEQAAHDIIEAVARRREEALQAATDLSKADAEPDLDGELKSRLTQARETLAQKLAGVPAAKDLPGLVEEVRKLVEEIARENNAVTERRNTLKQALDLLKLDPEMPQTESTELRMALGQALEGAAKRPAEPSLKELEDGLESLRKQVEEANAAFDLRRKRAADLREKLALLKVPEAGEPTARQALEEEQKRIAKLLEGVPTDVAMDELGSPIESLTKKIEEMALWVTDQTKRRDEAVKAVLKDITWAGFSPAQAKTLRERLDEQAKLAADLWKLDTVVPEMQKVAEDARNLRKAVEPLVRRLGLIAVAAPTDSLPDEAQQWTELRNRASTLIAAMADAGGAAAPAAVLTTLEKLETALVARIAARKTSIDTLDTPAMGNLAVALGGTDQLTKLVERVPKAQLTPILAQFSGDEATLGKFINDALGGDPAMLDGMLRLGCDGDPVKLKALIAQFPTGPDAANLSKLIMDGGLNGRPETLAAILKTGCDGDPAKFVAFCDDMKLPDDQKKLAALLDKGGLGASPQTLGEMVKTKGDASMLKALGTQFDDPVKQQQLANLVTKGGLGDGLGRDPRTLAKLLDDPDALPLAKLEEMSVAFDGAEAEKLGVMVGAFTGKPDPTEPPVVPRRLKSLMEVFSAKPNPSEAIRDTFFGTIEKENRGGSAVSGATRGAGQGTMEASAKAIKSTDPAVVQASLAAGLSAAEAAQIAARAPGLIPADRDTITDAQALMRHAGPEGDALRIDGNAEATARAAAKERAKASYTGEGEVPEGEVLAAIAEADQAALKAEQEATLLADALKAKDAALAPAEIADAAGKIAAAVAAARQAVDGARRTGCLDAAKALQAALDAVMKRHAARLLAASAAPGAADALKAGVAADEAARVMTAAGGSPAAIAALKEAGEAARAAALATATADAVANGPTSKAQAEEAAKRAATGLTGASPPDQIEVEKAVEAAKTHAIAARDEARALASALANAPLPVDPGLAKRCAAAADAAARAAAETVDDVLRTETTEAAKAAAKAVSDAAATVATQAQTQAALVDPASADAVKAGFSARGALEALRLVPGVLPQQITDMETAIEAGDRAALMMAQAQQLDADPGAADRANAAARQAAETTVGGPADQMAINAAVLDANNKADVAALAAENQKNLLAVQNPPTAAQIKATQDAADAAIAAAKLTPDNAKRGNALTKAREAMAAVATALRMLATQTTATATTGTRNDAKAKTTTGVVAQRGLEANVKNAIVVTKANYPNANYDPPGPGPVQTNARNNITNVRAGYAGPRANKVADMDNAKEAANNAAAAALRQIADTDEPSRTAALNAARARALADLPGATPEQMRDATVAEAALAQAIAAKAKTDADTEINVTLVSPAGPAGNPAHPNPFASAAAPVDGLMKAAVSLKAAVAAAAERVDAATRAYNTAVDVRLKKNDGPSLNAENTAKGVMDQAILDLAALEPRALQLKAKAEANVKVRFRERAQTAALLLPAPWGPNIHAQCQTDLTATEEVASMAALIVAQSFTRAGPNMAMAKGRDALLDEAAKFALTPLSSPPPTPPEVPGPHTADMKHFSDRHAYEHCSFDPETVYYPDEMEDIVMYDMRDQPNVRAPNSPEKVMRETASFAKVNGFWPEGTTEDEVADYLGNVIAHINGRHPVSTPPPPNTLFPWLMANGPNNAQFPNLWGISPLTVTQPPAPFPINTKLSMRKTGAKYSVGQFFPLGMPLTSFFDMASIKKGLGK